MTVEPTLFITLKLRIQPPPFPPDSPLKKKESQKRLTFFCVLAKWENFQKCPYFRTFFHTFACFVLLSQKGLTFEKRPCFREIAYFRESSLLSAIVLAFEIRACFRFCPCYRGFSELSDRNFLESTHFSARGRG